MKTPIEICRDFEKIYRNENRIEDPKVFYVQNSGISIPVYHITIMHQLTQFVGYVKYLNRKMGSVYFRGQTSLYLDSLGIGQLKPSLFRQSKRIGSTLQSFNEAMNPIIEEIFPIKNFRNMYPPNEYPYAYKFRMDTIIPLLQHYGIMTQWIDIVDNLWIALWFASHKADVRHTRGGNYSTDYILFSDCMEGNGYLLLLAADATYEPIPGVIEGDDTRICDMRKAVPSVFLRPHAQHALMLKKRDISFESDYSDRIVGIAEVPCKLAREWIGSSSLLTVQSLFPPAFYDIGYSKLLSEFPFLVNRKGNHWNYGSIHVVTD